MKKQKSTQTGYSSKMSRSYKTKKIKTNFQTLGDMNEFKFNPNDVGPQRPPIE